MDPLSEVLSLFKLTNYVSGGFEVAAGTGLQFPHFKGIKCFLTISGPCWLTVDGVEEPVLLQQGDCYLLPGGLPFCLATDLSGPKFDFNAESERSANEPLLFQAGGGAFFLGGQFVLTGEHSEFLLSSMPPLVHIRRASSKELLRWSLECLRDELCDPQPGAYVVAQQLAYLMLVQALRQHVQQRAGQEVGWLFALSDPQLRAAITCMHRKPGHPWTLQELATSAGMSRTVFAQRFSSNVGVTAMEYLSRWRMLLAGDRLRNTDETVSNISSSFGYKTDSAFGRAFRKFWGCSPREHRR